MTKSAYITILISFIAAHVLLLIDTAVDSLFVYHKPFPDVLLHQNSEISFIWVAAAFILFGFFTSRSLARHEEIEQALRQNERKYHSLVESTEDSIYVVDRDYRYLFMNRKHMSRMGFFSEEEYLGKEYSMCHSPDETKWFYVKAEKVFSSGISLQHSYRSLRDGRHFLQTLSPVKNDRGETIAITVVSKDVTERKMMEEQLRSLSLTDELTGLYNRRGFFTMAGQQIKMARRLKRGIFILYADVDNMKKINDTHGHNEGDSALVNTANILRSNYRESDIIARIGGDEFVVFQVDNAEMSAEKLEERLKESLRKFNDEDGRNYTLSVSVGIAYFDSESGLSIDEMLVTADRKMYENKKQR